MNDEIVNTCEGILVNMKRGRLVKKLFFTGGRYLKFVSLNNKVQMLQL